MSPPNVPAAPVFPWMQFPETSPAFDVVTDEVPPLSASLPDSDAPAALSPEPQAPWAVMPEAQPTSPSEAGAFESLIAAPSEHGSAEEEAMAARPSNPSAETTADQLAGGQRNGRASQQFFVWLPLMGGLVPLLLGGFLAASGAAFTAVLLGGTLALLAAAGVAALGAVISKRSGSSALVLSRAAFGVYGNMLPLAFMTILRASTLVVTVFIALAVIGSGGFGLSSSEQSFVVLQAGATLDIRWLHIAGGGVLLVAAILAAFGGYVLAISQRIAGIAALLSSVVLMGIGALSAPKVFSGVTLVGVEGAALWQSFALVFLVVGLFLATSSGDFTRRLSKNTPSGGLVLFSALTFLVIPLTFLTFGFLLTKPATGQRADLPGLESILGQQLATASGTLGSWLGVTLAAVFLLSVLVAAANASFSLSMALQAFKLALPPAVSQSIIFVLGLTLLITVSGFFQLADATATFLAWLPSLLVPCLAWLGIAVSDASLRRVPYHEVSLSRGYGFYRAVSLVNIPGFVLASALGLFFVEGPLGLSALAEALIPGSAQIAELNLGWAMAAGLALLWPIAASIPVIRRQEREVLNTEARRNELNNLLSPYDGQSWL